MKIYRLKLEKVGLYVRGVVFDTSNQDLKLKVIPTPIVEEAAWYEEDKAKKYLEELNKECNDICFVLEEVADEDKM